MAVEVAELVASMIVVDTVCIVVAKAARVVVAATAAPMDCWVVAAVVARIAADCCHLAAQISAGRCLLVDCSW